jgi:hypothetical protein
MYLVGMKGSLTATILTMGSFWAARMTRLGDDKNKENSEQKSHF